MNVLFVNTYYHGGGAEKVMRQLYQGLDGEEIHPYCLVGRIQKDIPENVEVVYKGLGERAFTTIVGGGLKNTLLSAGKAKRQIIRTIKEKDIDIVHFHNLHSNYLGLRDIRKIKKHCPHIVITMHDMWLLTGGCAHAFDCDKWQRDMCKNCQGNPGMKKFGLAQFIYKEKKKALAGRKIQFVVPSKWLKHCVENSYLKEERIQIIYNGISMDQFRVNDKFKMRQKYQLPQDKHLIMFAANGMNNVYKGFSYLQEALMALENKQNYALIVVGDKVEEKLSLPFESYRFGYVSSETKMNELYSAADLFLLPSAADTLPFTPMEAMASGTPVLAFDTGGIPEIVTEDTGWIVKKNSAALKAALESIFSHENKESYEKKRKNCRPHVIEFFDEKKMIGQYVELYQKMISE